MPPEPNLTRRRGYVQLNAQALQALDRLVTSNGRAASVLLFLFAIAGRNNVAFASTSEIARETGLSVHAVRRSIRALVAGRFISNTTHYGRRGLVINSAVAWRNSRKLLWTSAFDDHSVWQKDESDD